MGSKSKLLLLNLPEELLDQIISCLPFDEISRLRLVCQKFNKCCQRSLNKGFLKVERYHSQCLRDIKAQLPRRESERRDHALARHSDILTAIETRLSLLSMTFMKYVDMGLCCFIPGKVIDEIYLVLRNIQDTPTPPRSHEILQELRDISSMAMEHFDEHIVPLLKQRIGATRHTTITLTPSRGLGLAASRGNHVCVGSNIKQELKKLQTGFKQVTGYNNNLKKEQIELKKKIMEHDRKMVEIGENKRKMKLMDKCVAEGKKKLKEFEKKMCEQNQLLQEQATRIAEQDGKISEISRKLLEYDKNVVAERCSPFLNSKGEIDNGINDSTIKSDSTENLSILKKTEKVNEDVEISGSLKCSTSSENEAVQTRNVSKNLKRKTSENLLDRKNKRSKQKI